MSSDQLASSIDFLNAVENQTVVSLDDITTAIPKVAPVIQQLGGDVKDLAFFMAAMKEGGINASEGANALKSGLAALINPTEKASAMLAGYGININKIIEGNQGDLKTTVVQFAQALDTLDPLTRARAIEQLFGKFQFARLSTLFTNVINETGQASRVLDLAGTSIEDLAALSESELGVTADSAMNKFRKSIEDLKFALVPVGQTFLQAVTPILEFVGGIVEKFNNLSTGVKKAIVVLTVAIGAIGPIALMTFGLLANGLANIVKGAMVLRNGYLRLTGQTQILGEQTEYLTMEQIDAAAASHSLDQSHARLTQTFTAESSAVTKLIAAYQQATAAAAKFAAINPGMMRVPGAPTKRAKGFADGGIVRGPGSGTSDSILAMLSNGEAVIPAKTVKQFPELIDGLVSGNIPGFKKGTTGVNIERSHATGAFSQSSAQFQAALDMVAGLRELNAQFPNMVRVVSNLTAELPLKLNQAMKQVMLRGGKSSGGASIAQFESEYSSLSGKFSGSAKRGGADISSPGIQTALLDFEKRVGQRAVELAKGTDELKITDDLFAQATREVINEFSLIEGSAKQVASALDIVSKQVGQIRIQPSQAQYREGLASGAFSIDPTGKVARFGSIDVARPKSQTKSGLAAARPASNINLPGNYTTGKDLSIQATQVTNEAILATARAAGTNSPSKKTIPIGEDIARGLQVGMANQQDEVAASGQALGAAAVGGTQSGGGRQRRSASRPQGAPGAIGLSGAANSAVSPAIKEAINTEVKARKTSAARIDSMNRGLMAGTFALTSLAGAGSMAGGTIGNLSQHVMKFSGLLFALMSVTQLLTQAKFAQLVANRAATAGLLVQNVQTKAFSKTPGLFAGGIKKLLPNLLRFGGMILRMLGPVGLVTTGLLGLYSITKMINAQREKERQKLEAFSDVITVSTDKLKFLSEQFNFVPVKGSLETFGKDLERTSVVVRTAREELKESEEFQKTYGQDINQVRGMSDQQAETALSFMGLDLISQGMAKEQVQLLIDTIKEEAGKKDLKFDFKSITFDEKGMSGLNAQFDVSIKEFAETAQKGFEKVFTYEVGGTGRDAQTKLVERLVPNEEARAAIKNAGALVASYSESLNRLATSGSIGMEELTKITDSMFSSIAKSAPDASMQIRIFNAALNAIDPVLSKAVKGVKNLKDMQLLLKSAISGVNANLIASASLAFRTAEELNKVAAANLKAFGVKYPTMDDAAKAGFANNRAVDFRIALNKAMKEALELAKELNKIDGTIGGDAPAGTPQKSPFQLAIEQLVNQRKELENTKNAYELLTKEGFDSATATKYASDSVIALGLATGNIDVKRIDEFVKKMKELERLSGSETIRNFLKNINEENTLKKSFAGIIPNFQALGATTKDIESVLNNPTLMESFVDGFATLEQRTKRMQEYLAAIRSGEAIDIEFNLLLNSDFELAIEQLQKQQKELINTEKAYKILTNAGFDSATATKYASDAVIALGLATGKISTEKIEEVATLMEDIEKRSGSEAIKNFLDSLGTENKLKESLLGIVPTLLTMGATTKDIENILGNSELTRSFVDPLATAEQKAERIQKYLDAVRTGEAIDIQFNLLINPDEAKEELKKKADELFGFLERAAQREYKPKIIDAEQEVKNAEAAVDAVQSEIDSIQKGIDKEQRNIELEITRPIEDLQEEINDLQRGIELEFDRPLAALSDESFVLSEQLVLIDKAADSINSKYDAQAEALNKVSEINSDIINQQKQQLGLADALTQGDISAAARAAQEMRASQAEASVRNAGDIIQAARDAEIAGLRSPISGLTRKQIEDRQFQIERETFNLNLRRKDVDEKILAIQDKIYLLEEDREKRVRAIRLEEDKIYEITNKKLVTAQKQLDVAQKNLDKVREELQARLDDIEAQRDAWQAAADAEIAAAIAAGDYNDAISKTIEYLDNVLSLWLQIAEAAAAANLKTSDAVARAGESLTRYVPPTDTPESVAALEEFISIVEELDAAQAAADEAAAILTEQGPGFGAGSDAEYNRKEYEAALARLAAAQAAYDATLPVLDASATGGSGSAGGGRFGVQYLASGGMVSPKYFAAGGMSRGSDTVPAMLTPGEFVMNKNATKKFGPLLASLNKGQYPRGMSQPSFGMSSSQKSFSQPFYSISSPTMMSSPMTSVSAPSYNSNSNTVYNYSVGINVGGSNINPDSIAKSVMNEIRYIDSQRVRGQRG
jgi:TP901 family phage tail tape measure protein